MHQTPFDRDAYAKLLVDVLPVVIESEEDHERMLSAAESLMERGETLSAEEKRILALLVYLIEAFEHGAEADEEDEEEDDEPATPPKPYETLQRLMRARGLALSDVADLFGSPRAAQEALEGKRPITRGQAKQLARYFRVPDKLFTA